MTTSLDGEIKEAILRQMFELKGGGIMGPPSKAQRLARHEENQHGDSLSVELLVNRIEDKDAIINGISDALMLLDAKNYKILDVNQAFLNSYRFNLDQVLGKTCHEITHHRLEPCSESPASPCPLRQTVLKGRISRTEHVHKDREGNKLYFEITSYPLRDSNGDITRIVHLSRDVTERKRAEEALKERVTRSEHLAALGQLVSEITHEIRNPLMMIGGIARQLLQPPDETTRFKKLTILTEQVARLEKLLAGLREYYLPKISTCEPVNVSAALEKIFLLIKDECTTKGIRSELKIDRNPLMVNWDPDKLEQVLLNVTKNAIEALENGGNIFIFARLSGDEVKITVYDDGCGIPKKHMEKIFDCFFTTKSNGTGLGLCICKKYIDEHEGSSFLIKSEDGKGTTVEIGLSALKDNETDDRLERV